MRIRLLIAGLLLTVTVCAQDNLIPAPKPKNVVSMAPAPPVGVTPGKPAHIELQFRVAPGYHINSHKPTSDYLIPTTLKLDAQTGLMVSKVQYPAGENLSFAFAPKEKLNVYTGDFTILAQVSAAFATPLGRYRIHGRLTAQPCDDKACYPPKDLPIAFDVRVGKPTSGRVRRNPAQSPHIRR